MHRKIAYKAINTINNLLSMTPKSDRWFTCTDCNKAYIGQTDH
jgi:hypothetical protein